MFYFEFSLRRTLRPLRLGGEANAKDTHRRDAEDAENSQRAQTRTPLQADMPYKLIRNLRLRKWRKRQATNLLEA